MPTPTAGRCGSPAGTAPVAEHPRHWGWVGDRPQRGRGPPAVPGSGLQPSIKLPVTSAMPRPVLPAMLGQRCPRPATPRPGEACGAPGWGHSRGRGRDPSRRPGAILCGVAMATGCRRPSGQSRRSGSRVPWAARAAHVTGTRRESGLQLPACHAPPRPRIARREALCRSSPLPAARPKHGGSWRAPWPRPLSAIGGQE